MRPYSLGCLNTKSAFDCFELSLEGFEWTLHSGERQLTETSEWLLTAFELRWKAGYDF